MKATIDITPEQRKTLLALLRRFIPGVAVWAYGSRVKWTARPNSDLDLVAFTTPLQSHLVSELKEALGESNLPFLVDLHVWEEVPERFHEIIRKEYVVLQEVEEKRLSEVMSDIWPTFTVAELVTRGILERPIDGNHGETHPKSSDFVSHGVPFIMASDLSNGSVDVHGCSFITLEQAKSLRKGFSKTGDVLLSHKATLGRTAIVGDLPSEFIMLTPQVTYYRVRDHNALNNRFLKFYFDSAGFQEVLRSWAGAGSTRAYIGITDQLRLPILLPPIAEQKAIAAVLGALDDKIELNRRMNATLEAMARALFQSWFVDFDPVRAKLDGRQPAGLDAATATLFPDHFQDSPLGHIPLGWAVGTIEDATSLIIDYRGRTPKKMGSDWSETGIPAISAKNVKAGRLVRPEMFNFVSEELFERWMKDKLAIGDILMTSEAPLGELCYLALEARYCLSQRVFALRANPANCESTFLYYWLESPSCHTEIINRGTGTTVEGIRQSELRQVAVLLPPIPIQKAAARFLAEWTEQIHRNEEQSRTLAILRDALLPKLLSGELRTSERIAEANT